MTVRCICHSLAHLCKVVLHHQRPLAEWSLPTISVWTDLDMRSSCVKRQRRPLGRSAEPATPYMFSAAPALGADIFHDNAPTN